MPTAIKTKINNIQTIELESIIKYKSIRTLHNMHDKDIKLLPLEFT
jgi:hypothetical protein